MEYYTCSLNRPHVQVNKCDWPAVVDLRGAARDVRPPGGPNSFNFMQCFGKISQNRMFASPPQRGVGAPTSVKSWISYWPGPCEFDYNPLRSLTIHYNSYIMWKVEMFLAFSSNQYGSQCVLMKTHLRSGCWLARGNIKGIPHSLNLTRHYQQTSLVYAGGVRDVHSPVYLLFILCSFREKFTKIVVWRLCHWAWSSPPRLWNTEFTSTILYLSAMAVKEFWLYLH